MTTVIPLPIQAAPQLDEVSFCAWAAQAAPGEALEYHRGFLALDRTPFGAMQREGRAEFIRMTVRARQLAERGLIHLVQRRLGSETFSYLAIARSGSRAAVAGFARSLAEEAA